MTSREELLALADEWEAGTAKCVASGYEEFGAEFLRQRKLVVDALRFSASASGSVDREAIARMIDPSAWRDEGYSWAKWRIEQSLKKADAILALLPAQAVHPDVSALRRALATCRDFIRDEQIENAVVCVGSMQSLGDMIDEALAATSSREVSEEKIAYLIRAALVEHTDLNGRAREKIGDDAARAILSRYHVTKKEEV